MPFVGFFGGIALFFLPYFVDVAMDRRPWANWLLILLTCVVSISLFPSVNRWDRRAVASGSLGVSNGRLVLSYHDSRPRLIDDFLLQPHHFKVVQLVGDLFLHEGWLHLLGNMLFLWLFGNAINAKLGHMRFLALYFAAGIFEGLVYLAFGPNMPCLGASGAIMGVMGAFLILYPHNNVRLVYLFFLVPGFAEFSSFWLLIAYAVMNVWGMISDSLGGIAYISHVAGFALGAGVVAALVWRGLIRSNHNEENIFQLTGMKPMTPRPPTPRRNLAAAR